MIVQFVELALQDTKLKSYIKGSNLFLSFSTIVYMSFISNLVPWNFKYHTYMLHWLLFWNLKIQTMIPRVTFGGSTMAILLHLLHFVDQYSLNSSFSRHWHLSNHFNHRQDKKMSSCYLNWVSISSTHTTCNWVASSICLNGLVTKLISCCLIRMRSLACVIYLI